MPTRADAAAHIDMGERRFGELIDARVIARAERGAYDLDAVRVAYIRHLRDMASGRTAKGDLDPAQERARKDRALAEGAEMKNAVTRGELVSVEAVGALVDQEYSVVRERLLAVPGKLGSVLAPEHTGLVQAEIYEALAELSAGDEIANKVG